MYRLQGMALRMMLCCMSTASDQYILSLGSWL
jgi:hypothetical protein